MTTHMSIMRSRPRPKQFKRILKYAIAISGAIITIYPLLWLFSASFKPDDLILNNASLFSSQWITDNYTEGWNALDYPFILFFMNSLIVCLGAVLGNVISCSLAAYAFARLRFKYKRLSFVIMQRAILLPTHVLIVPQYILFKELGWVNTFLPMVVPKFLATDAFFIFLMIQFMRGIPTELDDAAKLDGCGKFAFYWHVIVPLSLPALVTTAIFTFIWTWNDFFTQLIFLNDESLYTVPIALRTFLDSSGNSSFG